MDVSDDYGELVTTMLVNRDNKGSVFMVTWIYATQHNACKHNTGRAAVTTPWYTLA